MLSGSLRKEMRRLGSVILESAEATRVPAGGALAGWRRDGFLKWLLKIANHPLIEIVRDEITVPTECWPGCRYWSFDKWCLAEIHALNGGDGFWLWCGSAIIGVNTVDMSKVYLRDTPGMTREKLPTSMLRWPSKFMDFHDFGQCRRSTLNSFEKKYFEGCSLSKSWLNAALNAHLALWNQLVEYQKTIKGLVMVTLKHRMQLFGFVRIMLPESLYSIIWF